MISPPSKEQFNSRPEDSWPLFSLEFFWHGTLTELRVSDYSPEAHRFIQLSAVVFHYHILFLSFRPFVLDLCFFCFIVAIHSNHYSES